MKLAIFICGALISAASSATIASATIDFDTLTGSSVGNGEVVTTQYQGLGVTFFDSYQGARATNTLGVLMPTSSAPNVLWVDQGSGYGTDQYLLITFATPIQGIQALFGTNIDANITLETYSGAAMLSTTTLVGSTVTGGAFGLRSGTIGSNAIDITSVKFYSRAGTSAYNFSLDNIILSPVPEPATSALLAGSLIMLGAIIRRKTVGVRTGHDA